MNKQVLKLAIPSILANITIPLVGLVDTAIVGHISDVSAIGGIAVGTMLFDSSSPLLKPFLRRRRAVLECELRGLLSASEPDAALIGRVREDIDFYTGRLSE